MTIVSISSIIVSVIFLVAGIWLIYVSEKKRWVNEAKEAEFYARSLELDEAEKKIETRMREMEMEMGKERTLLYQRTINELEKIKEHHREETLRQVASEAEREYVRQVALMAEEKDKYISYLNAELEEDSQSFLESINTLRFMERKIVGEVEDVASRLVSLIEAEKSLLDENRQQTLRLPLSREDVSDLKLLVDEILPRIRREDVIRKLVWVEYIQKPTFALVSDVFPMNTPGIYKITNINTKKSYVGRSVDVRARVVEHIRSSLGLGSIADQAIHHAMREEGLENFMFELLEDCEKDKLAEREKYYIDIFQSNIHGYNKNKGG